MTKFLCQRTCGMSPQHLWYHAWVWAPRRLCLVPSLLPDGFDPNATKYKYDWEKQLRENLDHYLENKHCVLQKQSEKWFGYWLDSENEPQVTFKSAFISVSTYCPPEALISFADQQKKFWIDRQQIDLF
jgi:hypothetical protein